MIKYYRDSDDVVYGYEEGEQDELIFLAVGNGWEDITGSWPPPPAPSEAIKVRIYELEARQTARRIREAAMGIDKGWLADLDAQIAALRAQL